MRRTLLLPATLLGALLGLAALGACGDNLPAVAGDAGIDAPSDATVQPLAPCLARPTDLARPPMGQLPCELLPPGFTATRGT